MLQDAYIQIQGEITFHLKYLVSVSIHFFLLFSSNLEKTFVSYPNKMATGSMPSTQSVTAATLSLEEILRLLDSSSKDSVCDLSYPEDGFDGGTFTG